LNVLVDASPPTVEPPVVMLVKGDTIGTSVPAQVSWPAGNDVGIGVSGYDLDRNVNGRGWAGTPSGSALNRYVKAGLARNTNYRYSVRALDGAANIGAWGTGPSFRVVTLSEASPSIVFRGSWSRITSPSYDGKAAKSTRTAGASATYTFVGMSFAWVSATSPVRGSAAVYVDGTLAGMVNTYSTSTTVRQMVFTRSWSKIGRHTVKIVADGTPGHPRVDIDAFVVLASPTITVSVPPAAPQPTPTPTPTPTPGPTPSPSPSPTPGPSPGPTPSPSPSPSPTPIPSATV
jgi:hypothetical protein